MYLSGDTDALSCIGMHPVFQKERIYKLLHDRRQFVSIDGNEQHYLLSIVKIYPWSESFNTNKDSLHIWIFSFHTGSPGRESYSIKKIRISFTNHNIMDPHSNIDIFRIFLCPNRCREKTGGWSNSMEQSRQRSESPFCHILQHGVKIAFDNHYYIHHPYFLPVFTNKRTHNFFAFSGNSASGIRPHLFWSIL